MSELKLLKVEDNEFCRKLLYLYKKKHSGRKQTNREWIKIYQNNCRSTNTPYKEQGTMSDIEYILSILPIPPYMYFLMKETELVGEIDYVIDENNYAFLNYYVIEEHRKKGYATMMCQLLEKELFNQSDIKGMYISDFTFERISTKIAQKLGYQKNNFGDYIKDNPNFKAKKTM